MQWCVPRKSGAGFEGKLNKNERPHSIPQKRRFPESLSLNIATNNDKLQSVIWMQEHFRKNLVKEWG
jgi:hypothetical protein